MHKNGKNEPPPAHRSEGGDGVAIYSEPPESIDNEAMRSYFKERV